MSQGSFGRHWYGRHFLATALLCIALAAHTDARAAPGIEVFAAAVLDGSVPVADHHQHLLSPAGAELQNRVLTAVPLPPALARLVRDRARAWNDKNELVKLFTADALVFSNDSLGWVRGRAPVAAYLSTRFASAYHLTPVVHSTRGTTAHIAGYFTRGEGSSANRFGYFTLELERGRDRKWRISAETPIFPGPKISAPQTARQLIAYLDEAGIGRAAVLSDAYFFDSPKFFETEDAAKVRAENDWTAQQVAQFPDRLVGFCSFNPLKAYALAELDRCAANRRFAGLKLHFGMSGVDLRLPGHVKKVRAVVGAADRLRMPIIVHVRADANYGHDEASILLNEIISAAPAVPFQIAHLWGGERFSDAALGVYADAVSNGDPRARNLYFDIAEVALAAGGAEDVLRTIAARIRQIGLGRVLYGSDGPAADSLSPVDAWKKTRELPLTAEEFRIIANNIAPYLR